MSLLLCSCQPSGEGIQADRERPAAPPKETLEQETPAPQETTGDFPDFGIPFTHEQMEEYRQVKEQIWASPLGRLLRDYVSSDIDRAQVGRLSSSITERVFSFPDQELIRIAALQVLIEDLYERGEFTPELSYRITILWGNVHQRQFMLNTISTSNLIKQVPIFAVFGFFTGSRLFMTQLRGLSTEIAQAVSTLMKLHSFENFAVVGRSLNIRSLLSRKFFARYNLAHSVGGFFDTFGPYSFVYIYYYQRKETSGDKLANGKILIYGMKELIQMGEL